MNNNRLSTNIKNLDSSLLPEQVLKNKLLDEKVKELLNSPSNFELQNDGKILIKSEQTYWKGRVNVAIEVFDKSGLLLYTFENVKMTTEFFNVKIHIIRSRLNTGKPLLVKEKEYFFKRKIDM
jgi:hypothetical protein